MSVRHYFDVGQTVWRIARLREGDLTRAGHSVHRDACNTGKLRPRACAVEQVEHREGDIVSIGRQCFGGELAGFFLGSRLGAASGKVAQRLQAAFAENASGRFSDDAKHAPDFAGLIPNGIVGDIEVRSISVASALHRERMILRPERLSGSHDSFQEWAQDVPNLAPTLTGRLTERPWVLGPKNLTVGVIVNRNEARSPEQDNLGF